MFGGLLLCAFVVAALLYMMGMTDFAQRLGKAAVILAVVVPLARQCLSGSGELRVEKWLVVGLGAVVLAAFALGYKRWVDHRRAVHHWLGEKPRSLKQRLEDDGL